MTDFDCLVCGRPAVYEIRRIGTDTTKGELCSAHVHQLTHKGQPNVRFDIGIEQSDNRGNSDHAENTDIKGEHITDNE